MESEKVNAICFTVVLWAMIITVAITGLGLLFIKNPNQDNETKSKIDAIHKVIVGS